MNNLIFPAVPYFTAFASLVILEHQYAVGRPGNGPVEELAASEETGPAADDLTMTRLDWFRPQPPKSLQRRSARSGCLRRLLLRGSAAASLSL